MLFRSFPWGALAFSFAVLALLQGSLVGLRWLTIVLAALSLIAALFGLPGRSSRRDRPWLIVGGLLGASLVALGFLAPGILNSYWALDVPVPESDPNQFEVTPRDQPRGKGKLLAADNWVDADKDAIRQDDILIWLDSVVVGRLPEKAGSPHLLVNIKVGQIRRERQIAVAAMTGERSPVLTDDAGRACVLVDQRPRQLFHTDFDPCFVDQILVFEAPATVLQLPPATVEESELQTDLKLEVRASAWGRQGVCRFRISSITDERDLTPAKVVAQYKQKLLATPTLPADPIFGRAVFSKFCYACHTIFGFGAKVGPDLTDRGLTPNGRPKRTDLDFLLTSIIHPSGEFAKDYEPSIVTLTNGQFIPGIVKAQTAETVTLSTPAKIIELPRSEVEEISRGKISLMPTDLLKGLDDHEVRSLISYITGPGQNPMQATWENTRAFFNGRNLDYWQSGPPLTFSPSPPTGERNDIGGWRIVKDELAAPDPHGGAPAVLSSELLVTPPFRFRMQLQRGKGSEGALAFYGEADRTGPALRVAFTADGRVELVNGSSGQTTTAPGAVPPDGWHNVDVNVAGKRVQMHLDGKEAGVLANAEFPERCFIALHGPAGSGQRIRFRNLDLQLPTISKK